MKSILLDNTIEIGLDSTYNYQLASVQGLSSSDIRTGSGLYAGRDLGFVSGQFLGYRTIVIKGFYIGATCTAGKTLRNGIVGTLQIRHPYSICIKMDTDEYNWITQGYLTDIKSDWVSDKHGDFQITFICPDPILYRGTSTSSVLIANTWNSQSVSGLNSTSPQTKTITNVGNIATYPKASWSSGTIENPTITNTTTGKAWSCATVPSGSTVVDFQSRKITVSGSVYTWYRNTNAIWWALEPGNNVIEFETTATSNRSLTFSYRHGKTGV